MDLLAEEYARVRIQELHREAEQQRLVKLVQSGTHRPLRSRLGDLRCQMLDLLAGLGFAIQACVVHPKPAPSR